MLSCAAPRARALPEPVDPPGPTMIGDPRPPAKLGQSDVMAAVLERREAIFACVEQQRAAAPEHHGKALARWRFLLSGEPTDVAVDDAPEPLGRCLTAVVASMRTRAHTIALDEPVSFPFKY